jgi:hypothetical protein
VASRGEEVQQCRAQLRRTRLFHRKMAGILKHHQPLWYAKPFEERQRYRDVGPPIGRWMNEEYGADPNASGSTKGREVMDVRQNPAGIQDPPDSPARGAALSWQQCACCALCNVAQTEIDFPAIEAERHAKGTSWMGGAAMTRFENEGD